MALRFPAVTTLLLLLPALVPIGGRAYAGPITFDNLPASMTPIANGYAGLQWNNFYDLDTDTYAINPSGYQNGTVSHSNVVYNGYGNSAGFSRATSFTLLSGYFTAAWNDGLSIQVEGFNGLQQMDQTSFVVDTSSPLFATFNWSGLTSVVVTSSGGVNHGYNGSGTQFVLDNLSVNGASVPEPAALALLGAGLAGVVLARRRP